MTLMETLLATGATPAEAFALAAQAHGHGAVLPLLAQALAGLDLEGVNAPHACFLMLTEVAALDPLLARKGLNAWGTGRQVKGHLNLAGLLWVTGLPAGFSVAGDLNLDGCEDLTSLPDGLAVRGTLWLTRTELVTLPQGLTLGNALDLRQCATWDGRIPEDTRIWNRVWTDRHPQGVTFREWRDLHPQGER
jgi:hypothetical protein